jgi:hypothetical protein
VRFGLVSIRRVLGNSEDLQSNAIAIFSGRQVLNHSQLSRGCHSSTFPPPLISKPAKLQRMAHLGPNLHTTRTLIQIFARPLLPPRHIE